LLEGLTYALKPFLGYTFSPLGFEIIKPFQFQDQAGDGERALEEPSYFPS